MRQRNHRFELERSQDRQKRHRPRETFSATRWPSRGTSWPSARRNTIEASAVTSRSTIWPPATCGTIANPDRNPNDIFGYALAWVGDKLARHAANSIGSGKVYLFNPDTGILLATFINPSPNAGDAFGGRLAAAGNDLVVSAFADDTDGLDNGLVYVFNTSTGEYRVIHNTTAAGVGGYFGVELLTHGSHILAGSLRDDRGAADSGAAFLFEATTGELLQTYVNPYPAYDDEFGGGLAFVGNRVAIGARFGDNRAGGLYVFAGPGPGVGAGMHTVTLGSGQPISDLSFGIVPPISDRGRVVFHSENAGNEDAAIYVLEFTANTREVYDVPEIAAAVIDAKNPKFAPNSERGDKFVFFGVNRGSGDRDIYLYDFIQPEGKRLLNLSKKFVEQFEALGKDEDPAFSPDGRTVVFKREGLLWALDLQKGKAKGLDISAIPGQSHREQSGPQFSPDGKWIAYWSGIGEEADIYAISANDALNGRIVTPKLWAGESGVQEYYPAFLDNETFMYATGNAGDDIYIRSFDTVGNPAGDPRPAGFNSSDADDSDAFAIVGSPGLIGFSSTRPRLEGAVKEFRPLYRRCYQ